MKENTRKFLRLALLVVFVVSTVLLAGKFLDSAGGSGTYADALRIATSGEKKETKDSADTVQPTAQEGETVWVPAPVEDDANMDTLAAIDLDALREVNPDVIGWILIPDSNINYPILQGEDNDFYLNHTWEGKKNSVGSIFLEHLNSPDFTDFNTIVYGHNMNDGSMFANVRRYSTDWYWERHPYIYIATDTGVYRYEVFSSYKAELDSSAYGLSFQQEKTRASFLVDALESSQIITNVIPDTTDRVLTLSTCSGAGYSTRWVVHARLKMVQVQ